MNESQRRIVQIDHVRFDFDTEKHIFVVFREDIFGHVDGVEYRVRWGSPSHHRILNILYEHFTKHQEGLTTVHVRVS